MAKNLDNVDVLTDTFNSWILRTNEVIDVIRTEVLTANSSSGGAATGTPGAPLNARLWGAFTANNLNSDVLTVGSNFVANSSAVLFGPVSVYANGSPGTLGQVLTTTGTGIQWASAPGTGTVTNIASGNGTSFTNAGAATNAITSTGTIVVKPGTGIVVNASGVSVNTAFLNSVVNPLTLQGFTWASPAAIGIGTANTGTFTTVTANPATGYKLAGDAVFEITNIKFLTPGFIEATTPTAGGGMRVRTNASGVAVISISDSLGGELNSFRFSANGEATYSNNFIFNGTATYGTGTGFIANTEIGYKTIPQITLSANATANSLSSGAHYYKTGSDNIVLTIANNATVFLPIGAAITIVNDGTDGNITIANTVAGGVTLQLGGSLATGDRIVVPGGIATALKVQPDKWIVSGSGVV